MGVCCGQCEHSDECGAHPERFLICLTDTLPDPDETPILSPTGIGDDPRGVDCWCKPCGSVDCAEFGPMNCAGRG